jgi:hypothetical protein
MNEGILTHCKQSRTFVFQCNAMYSKDDITPDSKSAARTDGTSNLRTTRGYITSLLESVSKRCIANRPSCQKYLLTL